MHIAQIVHFSHRQHKSKTKQVQKIHKKLLCHSIWNHYAKWFIVAESSSAMKWFENHCWACTTIEFWSLAMQRDEKKRSSNKITSNKCEVFAIVENEVIRKENCNNKITERSRESKKSNVALLPNIWSFIVIVFESIDTHTQQILTVEVPAIQFEDYTLPQYVLLRRFCSASGFKKMVTSNDQSMPLSFYRTAT